jgi:hypothetical protein
MTISTSELPLVSSRLPFVPSDQLLDCLSPDSSEDDDSRKKTIDVATTSMRNRKEQLTRLFPTTQSSTAQKTIFDQLHLFEKELRDDAAKEPSCCDWIFTPSSQSWRLNSSGKAETYTELGDWCLFAATATYQPGVSTQILKELRGEDQKLKNYPLTLQYLLEQESSASQYDEETIERLFTLFVEMVEEKQENGSEGLKIKVLRKLWSSWLNICVVLGEKNVSRIIQQVERRESFQLTDAAVVFTTLIWFMTMYKLNQQSQPGRNPRITVLDAEYSGIAHDSTAVTQLTRQRYGILFSSPFQLLEQPQQRVLNSSNKPKHIVTKVAHSFTDSPFSRFLLQYSQQNEDRKKEQS